MESIDLFTDQHNSVASDEEEEFSVAVAMTGDHPDPLTLSAPDFDDQGLLRWDSLPSPRLDR